MEIVRWPSNAVTLNDLSDVERPLLFFLYSLMKLDGPKRVIQTSQFKNFGTGPKQDVRSNESEKQETNG